MFLFIVESLSDEDRSLAEKIYMEYRTYIYAQAYKILNNRQDSEDVVEKVLLSILTNIEKFENSNENEIAAQIAVYTRNTAINIYRKNKRRTEMEAGISCINFDDDIIDVELEDKLANVESIILNRETSDIIRKHLLQLPKEQQDVITLVYGLGYSNVEAAKILGISPNAVGLRIHKAKKKLLEMAGGELRERME